MHFSYPNKALASADTHLECKTRFILIKLGELESISLVDLQSINQ